MSIALSDLIDGAKDAANLEDLGDGPNDFVATGRWATYVNEAIEALHKKIIIWNERALWLTQDYDLTATGGDITPPAGYRTFKQLSIIDDNGFERWPVHRFTGAQLTNLGEVHYQPQGLSKILLRPAQQSFHKYRLSYTAGPTLLNSGAAPITQQAADVTVKAMLDGSFTGSLIQLSGDTLELSGSLTVFNAAGGLTGAFTAAGAGVGKTLTANANGALAPVDGVALVFGNFVLINAPASGGGVSTRDYGFYTVSAVGNGGAPAVLTRLPGLNTSAAYTYGLLSYIAAGTVNSGTRIMLATQGVVLDTTPLLFVNIGAPTVTIDNVVCALGDKVFINTGGVHAYDGLYDVAFGGTAAPFIEFTRSAGQLTGTAHPAGYAVAVSQGATNGNKIWLADGAILWGVYSPTWSKLQMALDPLYEPSREWLEVRTAIRALAKEESNETANALNARLTELTAEAMEFYKNLDQGEAPQATRHDYDSHSLGWRLYNGII